MSRSKAPKRLADPELFKARLRYLCTLISRDRQGRCPINGVLLLMPISAADPKGDPDEFARCANMDLKVMFDAYNVFNAGTILVRNDSYGPNSEV